MDVKQHYLLQLFYKSVNNLFIMYRNLIKITFVFLFQFVFIQIMFSQENRIKDSLTIDETWKILSTYEKLSFDEGMEIIYRIKYDKNDTAKYRLLTDSIFNIIYKDFKSENIRNSQLIDSLINIVRDTLKFSLEINQTTITDYKNIKFYLSYILDNKRNILKLQTIDNLIILPSYNQVFDSVYVILQYKDIFLNLFENSNFKGFYHLKELVFVHESYPYINKFPSKNSSSLSERAKLSNFEGWLYVRFDCFGDPCTSSELFIQDVKKYYKFGKQLVKYK